MQCGNVLGGKSHEHKVRASCRKASAGVWEKCCDRGKKWKAAHVKWREQTCPGHWGKVDSLQAGCHPHSFHFQCVPLMQCSKVHCEAKSVSLPIPVVPCRLKEKMGCLIRPTDTV